MQYLSVDDLDYYSEYVIKSIKKLNEIIDNKGYIYQDLKITGEDIKQLHGVIKIYGHLNLSDNSYINSLGELNYIKSDLWLGDRVDEEESLISLGNLKRVGGDLSLRYSNIEELGGLERVGGNVNLRDTPIISLGVLKHVGGNLFLPKRLENKIDLSNIEIKGKIRYWNDFNKTPDNKLKVSWSNPNILFSNIHNLEIKNKSRSITGEMLVKNCFYPDQLNQYILDNIKDFYVFIDDFLENTYGESFSFYEVLFNDFKTLEEINLEFPKLKVDKKTSDWEKKMKRKTQEFIRKNKNIYPILKYERKLIEACSNSGLSETDIWNSDRLSYPNDGKFGFDYWPHQESNKFVWLVESYIRKIFHVLVFEKQNDFRESRGIPRIGEGWVSETDLFYKLKESLSPAKVIHHWRPKWLGRQHIDIGIPELKIGIEYQGKQHDKPIDFFGGEEAFIKGQERDKRKKQLCKENNIHLIEVRKGYDYDELLFKIKSIDFK